MSKSVNSDKIRLRNVRLSFANLYTAKPYTEGQDPRFGCSLLVDPASSDCRAAVIREDEEPEWVSGQEVIKVLRNEALRVMREQYGENIRPADVPVCFGFGDKLRKVYEGYTGMFYIRAYNRNRPTVVTRQLTPVANQNESGAPYSGCYVNATITFWAQAPGKYGARLNGNLHAVQFAADGEAFTGGIGITPDEEFEADEEYVGDTGSSSEDGGGWDD